MDIKYKKIGVTEDGNYTKLPSSGVCMESRGSVKICTSRDTIFKPSNCLENIVNGTSITKCNIISANRNVNTPTFDYIHNSVLITTTKNIMVNILCDKNITELKVKKGSSAIKIKNKCALIYEEQMKIAPNQQEEILEILVDQTPGSSFKLPPNKFNINFTHRIDNRTDSDNYLNNYVPRKKKTFELLNIEKNIEPNKEWTFTFGYTDSILIGCNICLLLITLVLSTCMIKVYINKQKRKYNFVQRRRRQENIPV